MLKAFLKGTLSVGVHSGAVLVLIGILNRTKLGRSALGSDAAPQ
jgi:hypothetical protein